MRAKIIKIRKFKHIVDNPNEWNKSPLILDLGFRNWDKGCSSSLTISTKKYNKYCIHIQEVPSLPTLK